MSQFRKCIIIHFSFEQLLNQQQKIRQCYASAFLAVQLVMHLHGFLILLLYLLFQDKEYPWWDL